MKSRKAVALLLVVGLLLMLSACGSNGLKMSLKQIGEAVVYNRTMVGAGSLISDNIKNTISFENSDPNKMRYITNNLYSEEYASGFDVQIQEGLYYDAYTESYGKVDMRGVICFLKFNTAEEAEAAAKLILPELNTGTDGKAGYQLPSSAISVRQNVVCVIATQEPNPCFELKRVFEDSTYVK